MGFATMDDLGDRMKMYESVSTQRRAFKGQPLVVRLDGVNFHTFTRGLKRPYDQRLTDLMVKTTKELVDKFQADVGYVQSDEITLVWITEPNGTKELPFGGRFQKIESRLAGYCSAFFAKSVLTDLPEKSDIVPAFDDRAFVVPNKTKAYHAVLWRQQDCLKNAISMAAHSMFSHKSLQNLSGKEMQSKMLVEKDVNFNDYPWFFKRGTFVRRTRDVRPLTEEQLSKIPVQYRPTGPVERSFIDTLDIWLTKQDSPVDALFGGVPIKYVEEEPIDKIDATSYDQTSTQSCL